MSRVAALLLAGLGTLDLAVIDIVLAPRVIEQVDASASTARTDLRAARPPSLHAADTLDGTAPGAEQAPTHHQASSANEATAPEKPALPVTPPEPKPESNEAPNTTSALLALDRSELARYALPTSKRRVYNLQFPVTNQDWVPAQAKRPLETIARRIQASPGHRAIVRGHADARGSRKANLKLAGLRAAVIADHLVSLGVPRERLETQTLGEARPAVGGHDSHAWFRNRRVEVVLEPPTWSRR